MSNKILLLGLSMFIMFGCAKDNNSKKLLNERVITQIFPIDASMARGRNASFEFKIPKKYRCLAKDQINNYGPIEYIPEEDQDPYNWSEIITLRSFVGKRIQAYQLVDNLLSSLEKICLNIKVLDRKTVSTNYSYFMIEKTYNGKKSIMFYQSLSGKYDCLYLMYEIVINKEMTREKAIKKINKLIKNNCKIITY
jgi:hypothetical protein